MPDKSKTSYLGRLHILTSEEIQNIFQLPDFSDAERLLHFSLSETLLSVENFSCKFPITDMQEYMGSINDLVKNLD